MLYSLEMPYRGASNEYPQHMFPRRDEKISVLFGWKKVPSVAICFTLES